jgi:hypothetical protein
MRGRGLLVASALALGGCGGAGQSRESPPVSLGASPECGTYSGRGCAPRSARVDLAPPSFTHPTRVTNPLNPIGRLRSAVLLGYEDGKDFRSETTLVPGTVTVTWGGRTFRALVSQYVAWRGGRIVEAALDRYAQADDGSVWYLGEDVFDYRDGAIASTEGTWHAGRDRPGAMIMPAHPKAGDTYRTENVPAIVFEEVTVRSAGRTVPGPRGPVPGAIVVSELHLDRTREHKVYAPGYGEFRTSGGGSLEALAVAAPTDGLHRPEPPALQRLSTAANGLVGSAQTGDWRGATATLRRMTAAWRGLRARRRPPLVVGEMDAAVRRLARAVAARRATKAGLAALDVRQAALDLELQYRPPAEIDRQRFELWATGCCSTPPPRTARRSAATRRRSSGSATGSPAQLAPGWTPASARSARRPTPGISPPPPTGRRGSRRSCTTPAPAARAPTRGFDDVLGGAVADPLPRPRPLRPGAWPPYPPTPDNPPYVVQTVRPSDP